MNSWFKYKERFLRKRDLKGKALLGSASLGIGAIFQRLLRLGRVMILARLLVPEDFGIVAITMMVVVTFESITDVGIRISIIQNKEGDKDSYLNAAWWFQSIRGLGLFILSFLFAPLIASFYDNAVLTDLFRISFLSIIFNGLISPHVHLLERSFRFGRWTLMLQGSALLGTAITIVLAYYLQNYWAVVIGGTIERLLYCVLSHILYPFRPRLEIDKDNLSELYKFAKDIFGLSVLNLIARQADVIVLGKIIAPSILGSYYLATQLAEQPISLLSNIFPRILLPLFSSMQGNTLKIKNSILSVNYGTALLGIPITVFMAINSYELLSVIYGNQYVNASLALSILSINIYIRAQIMLQTQIYMGIGVPHLHRRQSLNRSVFIAILIYPAAKYAGLWGAALVLLLANITMFVLQLNMLKRIIQLNIKEFFVKWIGGAILGMLVIIPNVFFLFIRVDSIMIQSVIAILTIILILTFGSIKLLRQAMT